MIPKKLVIDSDVLLGHLLAAGRSDLRGLMQASFCYTTVFNAAELFALCTTNRQRQSVQRMLTGLKILGLNGRSGQTVGRMIRDRQSTAPAVLTALIAGLCLESGLPLVTGRPQQYRGIHGLRLLTPDGVARRRKK